MNMNLFSIFDPSTSHYFSNNWISIFNWMFFIFFNYWYFNSRINLIFLKLILFIYYDLKSNFNSNNYNKFSIFISYFLLIFFMNFPGLFPYIFTASSHMSITMSLAFCFWLSFFMFFWSYFYNSMFSHLVPLGSPFLLASFMVIIETISAIIRPLTLAIRLSANMIAGHLLLSLLTSLSEFMMIYYFGSLPFIILLFILELAVASIQSYVFITLLSLYLNEQ